MYQFSRAIYRELAPQIIDPAPGAGPTSNHAAVLRACEAVIKRMAIDGHHFARPARTLFYDIRSYFPMSAQEHVNKVVCTYLDDPRPQANAAVSADPPQCRPTTRKGSACQRVPLARNGYCPSHQHLADTE